MKEYLQENQSEKLEGKGLSVTETLRSHFYESAKWAKIVAIIAMLAAGFIVIMGVLLGTFLSVFLGGVMAALGAGAVSSSMFSTLGFIYVIVGLLAFYIQYMLYKFAVKTKSGVVYLSQTDLEEGLTKLAKWLKINAIIFIVMLALVALVLLFTLIGVAMH